MGSATAKDDMQSPFVSSNCNPSTIALECYKCQSDIDAGCAFATLSHVRQWDIEICSECAVWIKNRVTFRGCKPNTEVDQVEGCRINSCNDMIFPRNRLQCYQCGGKDCIFPNETHSPLPCENFVSNDQCYTIVTDLNVTKNYVKNIFPFKTFRGCMSDDENSAGMQKCRENRRFCVKSRTNAYPAYTNLACIQCQDNTTTAYPKNCFNKTETMPCKSIVGRVPAKCYTRFDGDFVTRGCYDENVARECNQAGRQCHVCQRAGCNGKMYRATKCRKCDSRNDTRCIDDAFTYDYGFCMTANAKEKLACYRWEEAFCGILVVDGTKIVQRGCWHTIKDAAMKQECMLNTTRCKICDGENCNKK
ncbi:uncharacterized protein LOC134836424, partial [Culicoides brevitarsis]|uniref:uncharacterized protein LOC134836424 n=1 Tax=Culicoides brevitarsis TaxID=469753 RepID=UPI00307C9513